MSVFLGIITHEFRAATIALSLHSSTYLIGQLKGRCLLFGISSPVACLSGIKGVSMALRLHISTYLIGQYRSGRLLVSNSSHVACFSGIWEVFESDLSLDERLQVAQLRSFVDLLLEGIAHLQALLEEVIVTLQGAESYPHHACGCASIEVNMFVGL